LKLKLILVFLLALILGSNVVANTNDSFALDDQFQSLKSYELDANSMTWPMLPGESLNDIARLFYPKNQFMLRRYICAA
jgi:hypothetical protein